MPLSLLPYAAPSWIARYDKRIGPDTPRADLIEHLTLPHAWDGWFERQGIASAEGNESSRYEIMSMALNADVAGLGVALLPSYMVADQVAAGRLVALADNVWTYPKAYYLVYPEASANMKSLRIFSDWLLAQPEWSPHGSAAAPRYSAISLRL